MKKIIIEAIGGLGNQLFQYAIYFTLKKKYGDEAVYLYVGRYELITDNKGYQVDTVFYNAKSKKYNGEIDCYIDDGVDLYSRIRRKFFGRNKSFVLEVKYGYNGGILKFDENRVYYLRGLWQSPKYFNDYQRELRSLLSFPETYKTLDNNFCNDTEHVSLHVRRGDYISNPKYNRILNGVCDDVYYKNALAYLEDNIGKKFTILVFSDDLIWVRDNFKFLDKYNVRFIHGFSDFEDLYLMSRCDHNIIANSTFSWWGAWLNSHDNKIVVAPKLWFKSDCCDDLIPEDWIRL